MKTKKTKILSIIFIISTVLLFGVSITYAHRGYDDDWDGHMGYHGRMMGPGYGYGHMKSFDRDDGPWSGLSDEDRAKLDELQESFYQDTKNLREQIYEKRSDLRDEMAKDNPDQATVTDLQKQISNLQAEFDQKRVKHQLAIRKLLPEDFHRRGYYGRGAGGGPGYCW